MKESAKNHSRLSEHDLQFHQAIFQAAGNRVCSMMFTVIHRSLHNLIELTSQLVPLEHTLHLHERIYTAIRRGDPDEARKRMAEHLLDAQGLLARANDQQQSSLLQDRITALAQRPAGRRARRRES